MALLRKALWLLLLPLAACGVVESGDVLTVDGPAGLQLALRELPGEALRSIGLNYGLAVVRAGAAAERAGLRVGDVVYGVNQTKLGSARDLNRLLAHANDRPLTLLVRRGKTDVYVDLRNASRPATTDTPLRT